MTALLTAREVAETVRASVDTVYRLTARGTLPAVRLAVHGPLRFRADDLAALVESRHGIPPGAVEPAAGRRGGTRLSSGRRFGLPRSPEVAA